MNEVEDLPFLHGLDVMMADDTLKTSVFSDVKKEEKERFHFKSVLEDTDMVWNTDAMNNGGNLILEDMMAVSSGLEFEHLLNDCSLPENVDSIYNNNMMTGGVMSNNVYNTNSKIASYSSLINGNPCVNNNLKAMNEQSFDNSFDEILYSVAMDKILNNDDSSCNKDDQLQDTSASFVPAMNNANIETEDCKLSPTHSDNSDSWDSGVSADDESTTPSGTATIDQQLSPESHYNIVSPAPEYLTSYNNGRECMLTPHLSSSSPTSSVRSDYTTSCSSSSSSPNSSPPQTIVLPSPLPASNNRISQQQQIINTVPAVLNAAPHIPAPFTINATKNTSIPQQLTIPQQAPVQVTSTSNGGVPQFSLTKQPLPNNYKKYTITKVLSNNGIPNRQPITVVRTPTIINSNNVSIANSKPTQLSNSNLGPKTVQTKASPYPSVMTLSGVNKTAGITKSPAVLSVNRKSINAINSNTCFISPINTTTTTSGNSNNNTMTGITVQQKPTHIISTSSERVTSTINSGNSNNKSVNMSANSITLPRSLLTGIVLQDGKSNQSKNLYFRARTGEKFKLITNSSNNSNPSLVPTTTLSTSGGMLKTEFRNTNPNRNRTTGVNTVTSSTGMRSSALWNVKNVRMPINKGVQHVIKEDAFNGLVTIPKEETIDSDEEMMEPEKGQALVLTDEERKLAMKERIELPTHYPLTRAQERELKRIRRKLRNKQSAQDSRKRKKEHLDNLVTELSSKAVENGQLKQQLANMEEMNKKLQDQLKKFQAMMAQSAPSLTRNSANNNNNNNNNNSNNNSGRQQHQITFFMIILSLALFVYPSVLPQGKISADLLTAVQHKMPAAGNTRSLLEARKDDDDIDIDTKSIAALTDHDYEPASKRKRGRFSFSSAIESSNLYCMPQIDDELPSPRKKQLPYGDTGGGISWHETGDNNEDDAKGKEFILPDDGSFAPPDDPLILNDSEIPVIKIEEEESKGSFAFIDNLDQEIAAKLSQSVINTVKNQLDLNQNWTQHDLKIPMNSLSPGLVVELASQGAKRFREEIELE